MLTLLFRDSLKREIVRVPAVECRGGTICVPQMRTPLATFNGVAWVYAGQSWITVECHAMVAIRFEDPTGEPQLGIEHKWTLRLRHRYAFAGREVIAKLSPDGQHWIRAADNKYATMHILPADSSAQT
jgi:hypothetical protein